VAGTLYEVLIHPVTYYPVSRRLRVKDPQGRLRGGGRSREKLALWPLDAERTAIEIPILARDCRQEFGPTPSGYPWRVDHPVASMVQLADGGWHNVIGFRICDEGEVLEGIPPAPQGGTYLEEVLSKGAVIPLWNF
jgi:hypothetical protein